MKSLEKLLGRSLDPALRESVDLLTSLSAEQLEEAAQVARKSRVGAVDYLQFFVKHADLDFSARFIDEVLLGHAEASTWGVSDALVFARTSAKDRTQGHAARCLARVDAVAPGSPWSRIAPTLPNWHSDVEGVPGIVVRGVNYAWVPPEGLDYCVLGDEVIETPAEPVIAWRRWVASRIGWMCRTPGSGQVDAARVRALPTESMSMDGRAAQRGLLLEASLPPDSGVPGFRGPDSWYRDELASS